MRWPWEKKAAPAAPARPAFAGWAGAGDAGHGGYERQVREALGRNAVALRAVRMVAEGAAGVPLMVEGGDHPALGLVPGELIETLATQLLLHGNAWVETGLDGAGRPAALWALRPERVSVETDKGGWPVAWVYRVNGQATRYPAHGDAAAPGLVHIRTVNPLDDHLGLGCLGAAADAVALLNAAAKWNRGLMDNMARPSGALVYAPVGGGVLSAEQFDRLKSEVELQFAGGVNAGRPMVLDGGLSWQSMAMTPAEMDWTRAREAAAREVALAFGVPPMLLGLPGDATYANYAQANVALWRLTVLPLLGRITEALGRHLAMWWPGLRFAPDLDAVPALWADRELLWRHVAGADFLSRDEKRELLGWAPGSEA